MIYQRLAALFARYCAVHLRMVASGTPLLGLSGEVQGHVDRVTQHGQRIFIEGWADAGAIEIWHSGQRDLLIPNLQRPDVIAAFPTLQNVQPGFALDIAKGDGGVMLTLIRDGLHFVQSLPLPSPKAIARAKATLIMPFLRDLLLATPLLLHWFATKDPADRVRLKHRLRLAVAAKTKAMQPLLFLQDCAAWQPALPRGNGAEKPPQSGVALGPITIVLPVYNAFDLLPEVLDRLTRNTDVTWRLVVIEDASTDPGVRPFLRRWKESQNMACADRITLIENNENQGFIRAVNAGLRHAIAHGDHVVLLNSDAFVPKGWASRLMRPFVVHDRVATVTPMSNDAEIFSAPAICTRSTLAHGQADEIDALAARMHPDAAVADAPTGVGFCMAMSIEYLRRIPALDTAFGRGYGEEVDWCQKARALGGRNLGLANLFVEHRGGTSFGSAEKQRLVARNNAEISRRYPAYDAEVQAFIADDPLTAPRLALAIAWAAFHTTRPVPIYLAHNLGGGAEDYLAERIAHEMPESAIVLRVGTALRWQMELHSAQGITCGATDDFALIQRLLDPVVCLRIIYSCAVGDPDPSEVPARLLALKRGPQDKIEVLIHDYLPISPSYTLMDSSGRFAGLPLPKTEDAAHCHRRPNGSVLSLCDWQNAWRNLIDQADDITLFSKNSADILDIAYPHLRDKVRVMPHRLLLDMPHLARPVGGKHFVIGVLGNIGYHKGAGVLRDLSQMLDCTGAAKLVVLGQVDPMYLLGTSAHLHGGYLRREIPALAARYGITDWLIPSIWPETFSYTTHEAIATGLPVWCFDLGAQADAVRAAPLGGVIPIPDGVPDLDALMGAVVQSRSQLALLGPESCAA